MMGLRAIIVVLAANIVLAGALGPAAVAQSSLVGLNTDGSIYEVSLSDGALQTTVREDISGFSLGAVARLKDVLYYVASPSGSSENAIFRGDFRKSVISHTDLDRSAGNDIVRSLFFYGKKLFGVFYNGDNGTAEVARINPINGSTTTVLDLSDLDLEPLPGAISRVGDFMYLLARPENESTERKLVRFKPRAGTAKVFDVTTPVGTPVRCDRLKIGFKRTAFVCLASPSDDSVEVCRLSRNGRASCFGALAGVERLAGGHTMMTVDGKNYYAFVYAPGDSNSQRLIKFNGQGVLESTSTIDTIVIGARFRVEAEDRPQRKR